MEILGILFLNSPYFEGKRPEVARFRQCVTIGTFGSFHTKYIIFRIFKEWVSQMIFFWRKMKNILKYFDFLKWNSSILMNFSSCPWTVIFCQVGQSTIDIAQFSSQLCRIHIPQLPSTYPYYYQGIFHTNYVIFRNAEIFRFFFFSNNKIFWRKILILREYCSCQKEIFIINKLIN